MSANCKIENYRNKNRKNCTHKKNMHMKHAFEFRSSLAVRTMYHVYMLYITGKELDKKMTTTKKSYSSD